MIDFNEISAISKTWNYRKTEDRNGTEDSFTIPEYSEKLKLKKIGGKSVVWNQLCKNEYFSAYNNRKVSLTKNGDVYTAEILYLPSFVYEMMCCIPIPYRTNTILNHVYLYHHKFKCDKECTIVKGMDTTSTIAYTNVNNWESINTIYTSRSVDQNSRCYVGFASFNGITEGDKYEFKDFCLIDLTKLFGAGNEPTTTTDPRITAIKKYLETHPEYNEGEIIDSLVDEIEVKDTDEETTSLLPTNFPSLKSAGSVYDYIDFTSAVKLDNGNYNVNVVRNVGQVDLGSLDYDKSSAGDNRFYSTSLQSIIKSSCVNYTSIIFIYGNSDKTCMCDAIGTVYFILSPYTTTQEFKQAMEGQILYYELATPTIETITISAELLEWLKVEYGGNMYYKQDGLSLPIPNTTSIHKHIEKTEELSQIVIDDEVVWSAPLSMFNLYDDDDIIIDDEIPVNEDEVIENE